MNQIIPKSALKITSGGEPSNYSYKGDSGMLEHCTGSETDKTDFLVLL